MMSETGNKAFTLVEVMAAAAILSLGASMIYEAFFISLDAYDYYSTYLNTAMWMDEKVWQVQNSLTCTNQFPAIEKEGTLKAANGNFDWEIIHGVGSEEEGLHWVALSLQYKTGNKERKLSRLAFALYDNREEQ